MTVSQVGTPAATTYVTTSASAPSLSFGTGQTDTAGDLLVLVVTAAATTSVTAPSAPSGWQTGPIVGNAATPHAWAGIFYKVATGSDSLTSLTSVTFSGTGRVGYTLFEFSGVNPVTPIDTSGTYASGSASSTITSMTATTSGNVSLAGEYALAAFAREQASTGTFNTTPWTPGSGFSNFSNDGGTTSRDKNAVDYSTSAPTSGTTCSDAATMSSSASNAGYGAGVIVVFNGAPVITNGPPLGTQNQPAGLRAVIVRTGLAMASLIPSSVSVPVIPAPLHPFTQAVQARKPPPVLGLVYSKTARGYSTRQINASYGAPVNNPVHGPVFRPFTQAVRAALPKEPSPPTGRIIRNKGIRVQGPTSGPVFYPATSPARARIPRGPVAGIVAGTGSGGAICGAVNGNGFGAGNGSRGAPVRNPQPGPAFRQRTSPARYPLPPWHPTAGRIGFNKGAAVQNPIHGPPAYPLRAAVQARRPLPRHGQVIVTAKPSAVPPVNIIAVYGAIPAPVRAAAPEVLHGRVYSTRITQSHVPSIGPVFTPANQALRARLPQEPLLRGRVTSNSGGPVRNPRPGPVFYPAVAALRARLPQEPLLRGRITANPGAPVRNPVHGPVFRPATSPAVARFPLPQRGRVTSRTGTPVFTPAVSVLPVPRNFIRAKLPSLGGANTFGRAATMAALPAPFTPQHGPVFTQLPHPVQARFPLPPRGRITSNPGGPVRNPRIAPAFTPQPYPVRIRITLPPRGRTASNRGAPVRNPQQGPVFYPYRRAFHAPYTLPPRGRAYSNPGILAAPYTPGVSLGQPAGIRVIYRATGRAWSTFVPVPQVQPHSGPVFTQRTSPARTHPVLPPRGRIASNHGGPVVNPVRSVPPGPNNFIRAKLPIPGGANTFGRAATMAALPVPPAPQSGPAFRQATSPAQARRPLPPRGQVYSNRGAPVRNPVSGPVFRQKTSPVRAPIPETFSKGRVYSSPGIPAFVPITITGLFELVFPCAHLEAPASIILPPPEVAVTGTIIPGEIGPFAVKLPVPITGLAGTVLHQPLKLVLPLPVTSLTGKFNGGTFTITLPLPATGLNGKREHTGSFAIVFNICTMGARYGMIITPAKPLKTDFPESVDYYTGDPYVTWSTSSPVTSWIAG